MAFHADSKKRIGKGLLILALAGGLVMSLGSCSTLMVLASDMFGEPEVKVYPIEKPAASNPKLEKAILAVIRKQEKEWSKEHPAVAPMEAQKVMLVFEDWKLGKNEYGILENRYMFVDVLEKATEAHDDFEKGELFLCRWSICQEYISGTTFSETLKVVDIKGTESNPIKYNVNQDDAKKALAGDFSFVKE